MSIFQARTGQLVRDVSVPFSLAGQAWSVSGDTLQFAIHASPHLMARWALTTDSVVLLGDIPPQLLAAGAFYMLYGRPEVVPVAGGYLAQIPAHPGLQLLNPSGVPVREISLPAVRRLGTPPDLIEQHLRAKADGDRFQFLASSPLGMQRLSNGNIAVLQVDLRVLRPPPQPQFGDFRFYLSIVSADLSRACLDGELPVRTDATPMPAFVGDTLLFLSRLVGADDQVRNTVYSIVFSDTNCDWVPLESRP